MQECGDEQEGGRGKPSALCGVRERKREREKERERESVCVRAHSASTCRARRWGLHSWPRSRRSLPEPVARESKCRGAWGSQRRGARMGCSSCNGWGGPVSGGKAGGMTHLRLAAGVDPIRDLARQRAGLPIVRAGVGARIGVLAVEAAAVRPSREPPDGRPVCAWACMGSLFVLQGAESSLSLLIQASVERRMGPSAVQRRRSVASWRSPEGMSHAHQHAHLAA